VNRNEQSQLLVNAIVAIQQPLPALPFEKQGEGFVFLWLGMFMFPDDHIGFVNRYKQV